MKKWLFASVVLLLFTFPAAAQMKWNIVGSAGELDENSLLTFAYSGARLEFQNGGTGTIVARYAVKNTSTFIPEPNWDIFRITSLAGASSSVNARLISVEECTGHEELMCEIQITGAGQSPAPGCTMCIFPPDINFNTHSYYIEADINRDTQFTDVALITMSLSQ
jgi:hypothetical protein